MIRLASVVSDLTVSTVGIELGEYGSYAVQSLQKLESACSLPHGAILDDLPFSAANAGLTAASSATMADMFRDDAHSLVFREIPDHSYPYGVGAIVVYPPETLFRRSYLACH